jgi:glycosyltransferase involved in cell wall biosynthesis
MIMVAAIVKKAKPNNFNGRKILWVSFLILDVHFHKTSQLEILRNLTKRGYDTSLIAMRSKNAFQTENSQVRVISVPLRYIPIISPVMFAIVILFFLPLYIIFSKPDYIITDPDVSIFGFASAAPLSKLRRIKLVLDVRSTPVETVGFQGFLRTFSFATSIFIARKFFDGMTIITLPMKKEICKRFNINPKRVGIWSSGVSTTLFNPENYNSEGADLRRKLGLTRKFVVLYHGVFSANRGLTETVEAMSIVKRANSNVVFFLLGRGPLDHNLKDLIQMKKLQDNVIIHDPVEHAEVPKYIAMCNVGIIPLPDHPYWRFQCPLKLLEYLAMKKVVIATHVPAHQLVIGTEMCGLYISSVKPIEIAKSIMYAYRNREKLEEWGTSGRKIVEEKYSWEKVARDLENYLLSIDDVHAHAYNLLNIIPTCGATVIGDVTFTPPRVS